MQLLERVHLVQFFLFEAQTLELSPTSAIIAPICGMGPLGVGQFTSACVAK